MRRWQAFTVVLALVAWALSACTEQPPPTAGVRIAPGLVLTLPSPAALGRRFDAAQLVVARYGGETYAFEARVAVTPDRFRLVCIDPLGRKAMSIDWTDAGIATDKAPWLPGGLSPENMLADIVLLYWPEKIVRQALAQAGGTLADDAQGRSVRQSGVEIARADYQANAAGDRWNGWVTYRNIAWGYSLDIQSRIVAP